MADPLYPPGLNNVPREGDVAFAVSVATLYDLTIGRVGWDVRLTAHSHPTKPTLTLANRFPGGPVLNILPWNWFLDPSAPPVFAIDGNGVSSMQVSGYLDLREQVPTPGPPPVGSDTLRMYHRNGQLWFKTDGSDIEHQIPIGEPPGPSVRYAFWMGGG